MKIKDLDYDLRLSLLREIFDNTNIVLYGAYGAESQITGENITLNTDGIPQIEIDTEIFTG